MEISRNQCSADTSQVPARKRIQQISMYVSSLQLGVRFFLKNNIFPPGSGNRKGHLFKVLWPALTRLV